MEKEQQGDGSEREQEQRLPGWLWFLIFLFLASVVWGVDAILSWLRTAP